MSTAQPSGMPPPSVPGLSARIITCKQRKRLFSMKSDSEVSDVDEPNVKKQRAKKKNTTIKDIVNSQKDRIIEQDKDIIVLLEAVTILQNEVAQLKSKIIGMENKESISTLSFSDIAKRNIKEKYSLNENEKNLLHAARSEYRDCQSREKNLIIMGVAESTCDDRQTETKKLVDEIMDVIELDKEVVSSVFRFNKNPNSKYPSIIKVQLKNSNDRFKILKESKKLKDNKKFPKVFINMDLTFAQRLTQKQLILERNAKNKEFESNKSKYRLRIRNEKLEKYEFTSDNNLMDQQ